MEVGPMTGNRKERSQKGLPEKSGKHRSPADPENNLGRGAPFDRKERIEQLEKEEQDRRSDQQERRPEDLDREDAAIQREGIASEKPGIRPQGDADFVREKG